jgi:RNase P/RNase MRP subunit p30
VNDKFHIRSPLDVSCLGFIFGLSEEQGSASLSSVSKKALLAAECRRMGRTPVLIKYEDVNTSTSEEEEDGESDIEIDAHETTAVQKRKILNSNAIMNKKPKVS